MSYEGYYQILCENGHLSHEDAYECSDFTGQTDDPWKCSCGARAAWYNSVDTTNGSHCRYWNEEREDCIGRMGCSESQHILCKKEKGRIDGFIELEINTKEETETCKCCGHTKITKEKTYKTPTEGHLVKGE